MPGSRQPDYGLDAPDIVRNRFLFGVLGILFGCILDFRVHPFGFLLGVPALAAGLVFLAQALLMVYYARVGKFRLRERMLAMVSWRGDETVLDVGTGRGLLLIGAAKKLTTGRAIGIDTWSKKDLSDNRVENTLRNARLEGVEDKVEIRNEDAQAMRFADTVFDIVLSNLCLHNIPDIAGREVACHEIVRVLKKGGTALISDIANVEEYAVVFRSAGCSVTLSGKLNLFPPLRLITARKPGEVP